jgi:flagellar biosynthesis/type III secretory pathway M-ring protein FliF/YscJ
VINIVTIKIRQTEGNDYSAGDRQEKNSRAQVTAWLATMKQECQIYSNGSSKRVNEMKVLEMRVTNARKSMQEQKMGWALTFF